MSIHKVVKATDWSGSAYTAKVKEDGPFVKLVKSVKALSERDLVARHKLLAGVVALKQYLNEKVPATLHSEIRLIEEELLKRMSKAMHSYKI